MSLLFVVILPRSMCCAHNLGKVFEPMKFNLWIIPNVAHLEKRLFTSQASKSDIQDKDWSKPPINKAIGYPILQFSKTVNHKFNNLGALCGTT